MNKRFFVLVMGLGLLIGAMPAVAQNEPIPACTYAQAQDAIKIADATEFNEKTFLIVSFLSTNVGDFEDRVSMAAVTINLFKKDWDTASLILPYCVAAVRLDLAATRLIGEMSNLSSLLMLGLSTQSMEVLDDIKESLTDVNGLYGAMKNTYSDLEQIGEASATPTPNPDIQPFAFAGKGSAAIRSVHLINGSYSIKVEAQTAMKLVLRVTSGSCNFYGGGTVLAIDDSAREIDGQLDVQDACIVTISVIGVKGDWTLELVPSEAITATG